MDKSFILAEIKRLADANGGIPVGRLRLEAEAGIKAYHWKKHWSRYSDAVAEAGYPPNRLTEAYSEAKLIELLIDLARDIGRFPTEGDLLVRRTSDPEFPTPKTFARLGKKAAMVEKVASYCRARNGHDDILSVCAAVALPADPGEEADGAPGVADGHVYLMKSGRYYKIGHSVHAGARERQLAILLPDPVNTVHVIGTDDPRGIEDYWHQRFAAKKKNGEWFDLSREDIAAFRRRTFM